MYTREELQDMARCDELICSECKAYRGMGSMINEVQVLAKQLLDTMDRLEQVEKELLFREVTPNE